MGKRRDEEVTPLYGGRDVANVIGSIQSTALHTPTEVGPGVLYETGLNDLKRPFVISASGMCEAGRILHHLKNNIGPPRNLVLITGFQAENTLGRKIVDGSPEADFRRYVPPSRRHADSEGTVGVAEAGGSGFEASVSGARELPAQKALADAIQSQYGLRVEIPVRGNSYDLD